jgi:uncharacterized protein (TIGR03435 family)
MRTVHFNLGMRIVLIAAAVVLMLQTAWPQAQDAGTLTFEVASVKRNVSGRIGGAIDVPPAGTIRFTNTTLRILIRNAYQIEGALERYLLIIPGPLTGIIGSSNGDRPDVPRFDVVGKPPDNTEPSERRVMMRALLEDRFKLRVHREPRQMPAYALTVARAGRLGPNLVPSKFDCQAWLAQRRAGGVAPEPVDRRGDSWCLYPIDMRSPMERFAGPVRVLIQRVQPYVDRPIVDATGLSGNFEWMLSVASAANPSADVPGIFTALQDQLGLKLETRQAPVDVLVVDSVQLPTPD